MSGCDHLNGFSVAFLLRGSAEGPADKKLEQLNGKELL